jgi:NADH:ubiquinone oxidoreductase subunit 4 (subunit M)
MDFNFKLLNYEYYLISNNIYTDFLNNEILSKNIVISLNLIEISFIKENIIYDFNNYIIYFINYFKLIELSLFNNFINVFNILIFFLPIIHLFLLFFNKINNNLSLIISILKFNIICFYFSMLNIFDININLFFIIDWSYFFNINFTFGIDYISLSFIFLSDLLNIICLLLIWSNIKYKKNSYELLLISCNLLLSLIFLSTDLFIFYFFFELILIPMFFLISQWGSRLIKIHASIKCFI